MPGTTNKKTKLTFLHVTDCHLTKTATVEIVDRKTKVKGMRPILRTKMLEDTLRSLAEKLKKNGTKLDAVLFSGDGTLQGDLDGQVLLREMLLTELASVGITTANLIATPGNHDVVARSDPSDLPRYEPFQKAWINPGSVVVPFLDGVHAIDKLNSSTHVLKAPDGIWAIFPINTANWSQLSIPNEENEGVALLREHVNASGKDNLVNALEKLCTYDAARISEEQLSALKKTVEQTGKVHLRIAVLHHHLLPVNSSEEFKPFADITNLGQLRQVLLELGFHMVVHGHKHVTAAYYDHIYPDKSDLASAHRLLTVSGGTFGPTGQHPDSPLQLIEIDEIPHAPICKIRSISSATAGRELNITNSPLYRLWEDDPTASGPLTIFGTSIDDVYARAIQAVNSSSNRTIVCTIDFQSDDSIPFPQTYPYRGSNEERREWFEETVRWWQLPASRIEARIPYIHGSRLKRFGGSLDQIERVVSLLLKEKATSKAIALVVDPGRDFTNGKPFASFCFVQFCLRTDNRLDCIGYYRVQEFNYWWPVNVAELRHLQMEVASKASVIPGKITTITPYPRLSENIRRPTKVAVPLLDQWVDNHPVRIAQIALALANRTGDFHKEGIKFWKRCLDDLEQAATDFHTDGVQVSIEGLDLLKDWLVAAGGADAIVKLINDLLFANKSYAKKLQQNSTDEKGDFDDWKKHVEQTLAELRKVSLVPQPDAVPPV